MMVSIFVPTYNVSELFEGTLRSILSQTCSDLEVWLVDDASTNDTPALLDAWAAKDGRIHVIHKEQNEGFVPYSWNRVFPLLQGEWTLYLSHDDLLAPDCVEQLLKAVAAKGVDCAIPSCIGFEQDWQHPEPSLDAFNRTNNIHCHEQLSGRQAFARMLNYDIPGFALWRTSLIRTLGMPTEAFNSDEGMQRIWALHCQQVVLCPDAKFYYRIVPGSITKGLKPYHRTSLLTQRRLLHEAFRAGIWWRYPKPVLKFFVQYLRSWRYLSKALPQT